MKADEVLAEFARAMQEPEMVEKVAREVDSWAKIDLCLTDDDWNGATALNARQFSLDNARRYISAIFKVYGIGEDEKQ